MHIVLAVTGCSATYPAAVLRVKQKGWDWAEHAGGLEGISSHDS